MNHVLNDKKKTSHKFGKCHEFSTISTKSTTVDLMHVNFMFGVKVDKSNAKLKIFNQYPSHLECDIPNNSV